MFIKPFMGSVGSLGSDNAVPLKLSFSMFETKLQLGERNKESPVAGCVPAPWFSLSQASLAGPWFPLRVHTKTSELLAKNNTGVPQITAKRA